jgi:citrate synthase
MGIPVEMFPVMFAVARTSGWLAQWQEQLQDPDLRIARPRQVYVGQRDREYVAVGERLER